MFKKNFQSTLQLVFVTGRCAEIASLQNFLNSNLHENCLAFSDITRRTAIVSQPDFQPLLAMLFDHLTNVEFFNLKMQIQKFNFH